MNTKLKYERDRDAMTSIQNRHAFNIAVEYYNANLHEHKTICIGLFDLNGLKEVNDNYGHEYGDIYICDSVVLACEVFNEQHIFRIGGDEFAIILTDVEPHVIEEKHEKLKLLVAEYNQGSKFQIGIAFGYDFCLYEEESPLQQSLKRADANMYLEKKSMKMNCKK